MKKLTPNGDESEQPLIFLSYSFEDWNGMHPENPMTPREWQTIQLGISLEAVSSALYLAIADSLDYIRDPFDG